MAWGCVALYALAFAIPFWLVGWSVHWCRERFGLGWLWLVPGLQVAIEQTVASTISLLPRSTFLPLGHYVAICLYFWCDQFDLPDFLHECLGS